MSRFFEPSFRWHAAVFWVVAGLLLVAAPSRAGELRVRIEGLEGELLENARAYLSIEQSRDLPDLTELRVRALHRRADKEIRQALQPFGFYQPTVEATLSSTGQGWEALYRVDPGPPLPVTRLDVRILGAGAGDEAFVEARKRLPMAEGRRLVHADYEKAKQRLQRLAAERGYFDATFTVHEIAIDLERYEASIQLHLDTGERYRFGATRFRQQALDEALLRRFLPYQEGEPFDANALLDLQGALLDSDYFTDVRVAARPEEAVDLRVPVDVELTPVLPHRYSFGVGYGTDTGARASAGWAWRRINPAGHRFESELAVSEIRNSVTAAYSIPIRNPRTDRLVFSAEHAEEETDTSYSRLTTLGAAIERVKRAWRQTWSLELQREVSEVAGVRQTTNLILPGTVWQQVWADDRLDVRNGHRLLIDLHGGSETLGSDISFLQLRLAGKHIFTLWEPARLIGRWELGHTVGADVAELPATQRFFAGGDQSVRGYKYQSLGPTDASGEVIGGISLAVASVEYEHRFGKRWSGALFYDAGYAFDDPGEPVARGVGFGFRWRTVIGLLRLDLAQALDLESEPWRLHLTIGPDL
ncbi:MAG: autotransporter assembly complex family protein [Gammaproteobacteria bacterium]